MNIPPDALEAAEDVGEDRNWLDAFNNLHGLKYSIIFNMVK